MGGSVAGGGSAHVSAPHMIPHGSGVGIMAGARGVPSNGGRAGNVGPARWLDPSAWRGAGARSVIAGRTFAVGARTSATSSRVPLLGMVVETPRPRFRGNGFFFFGGGCFDGFFPGFCSFGPGSFGGPFFSSWWDWDNGGTAPLENFGYPYEPSMSGDIEARVENQPQYYEDAPYGYQYQYPPEGPETYKPNEQNAPGAQPEAGFLMLYLNDGTVYALTNYWVADGKLHYVTTYGGENVLGLDQIDVQHTVDVNAKRGVKFILEPRQGTRQDDEKQSPPKPQEP